MSSTIDKKNWLVDEAVEQVLFDIEYVPGEDELTDNYKVTNEILGLTCYADREDVALEVGKIEARAVMLEDMSLVPLIFSAYQAHMLQKIQNRQAEQES